MILHVTTCRAARSQRESPACPPSPQRHGCVPGARTPVRSDQRSLLPNGPDATDLYRCSPGSAGTAVCQTADAVSYMTSEVWTSLHTIWVTPTLASANDTREAAGNT